MARKRCKWLLAALLAAAVCGGALAAKPLGSYAEVGEVSPLTNFSTMAGHMQENDKTIKTEPVEGGVAQVTMDGTQANSSLRLFYGGERTPYRVNLTDFELKFAVNQLTDMSIFDIAFLASPTDYPMSPWGHGLTYVFSVKEGKVGFDISARKITGTQDEVVGSGGALRWIADPADTSRPFPDQEISMKFAETADKTGIKVVVTYTGGTPGVFYEETLPKAAFSELDPENAVLFFTIREIKPENGVKENFVFTVNEIDEPNTRAYEAEKAALISSLGSFAEGFAGVKTLEEFKEYLAGGPAASSLRKADLANVEILEKSEAAKKAEKDAIVRILTAKEAGETSDFTGENSHNAEGSAGSMDGSKNKLFFLNRSGYSTLAFKSKISAKDFEMTFSLDTNLVGGRFTLVFSSDMDGFDFQQTEFPGFKLTMNFDPASAWFILSDANCYEIPGTDVRFDEWNRVIREDESLVTMDYRTGDKATVRLKQNTEGDYVFSISANDTGMSAVIPAEFFADYEIDPEALCLILHPGSEVFDFAPDVKYIEMTVDSITDANHKKLKSLAAEYIDMEVTSVAGYRAAKEKLDGCDPNGLLFADGTLKTEFEAKYRANLGVLKAELLKLAGAYKSGAEALPEFPSQEQVDAVKALKAAYSEASDLLDDLPDADFGEIFSVYAAAERELKAGEANIGKGDTEPEEKGGCKGSVGLSATLALLLGGALLCRRKK